ncbi:MAG: hypothetical protein LBQ50_11875 [Planctomycetaceae bacterium]|jgi:hypothetical protein|nr:hypothetical protein [Planctomycetaceae bacterium]
MNQKSCFKTRRNLQKRHGVYLLDVCVGLVLVSTAMVVFSQSVFQLVDHRTDQKLRQIATDTLLNVNEMIDLETLTVNGKEQLKPLEEMVARSLPDGKLSVEKLEEPALNNLTLFQITISYENGKNRPRRELPIVRAVAAATSVTTTP